MPTKMMTRESLLEQAFSDVPSQIGEISLRTLSAGSFTLLGRLENPMMVGKQSPAEALSQAEQQALMFEAAIQYIWVHSAPLEKVTSVTSAEDIPEAELKHISFQLSIGQIFAFLGAYQDAALRMTASLALVEPEDEPGKDLTATPPAGSPLSSTPAEPAEIPFASVISFGSCPSSEHSPIFMPPTSPTEQPVDGPLIDCLPNLAPTS